MLEKPRTIFKKVNILTSILSLFFLSACGSGLDSQLHSFTLTPDRLSREKIQSRIFQVGQQDKLLRAAINVIQDQHYTIREVNSHIGMVYADQTNELGAPTVLFGYPLGYGGFSMDPGFGMGFGSTFGFGADIPYVQSQISSVSVVVYPATNSKGYEMRVSIELRNFLNNGMLNRVWILKSPTLYQKFFEAISKALYLEDHP